MVDALDHLRTGLTIFDPGDALVYCNTHFRYIYRSLQDRGDLIGMRFESLVRIVVTAGEIAGAEVIHDPERWITERLQRHRKRSSRATEQLADGRWIEIKERRLPDGSVLGQWTDVTELVHQQLRLESSASYMGDGIAIWNQRGLLELRNEIFASRFGWPEVGQPFDQVITTLARSGKIVLDRPAAEWITERLRRQHLPHTQQVLDYDDGMSFLLIESRSREGGVISMLTDITNLKQKEKELVDWGNRLESQRIELASLVERYAEARQLVERQKNELELIEARQRTILETMAEGLIVVDDSGTILLFNRSAETILGYPATEVIGANIASLMFSEDIGQQYALVLQSADPARPPVVGIRREVGVWRKDGVAAPLELALADASVGDSHYVVMTFQNIRDRKSMVERLEMSLARQRKINEEQRAFVAMANHEFRTPLAIIDGAAQLIMRHHKKFSEGQLVEKLGEIRSAVQRMTEQMESTLVLLRTDSGAVKFSPGPCNIGDLLSTIIGRLRMLPNGGEVTLSSVGDPVEIIADGVLLDHVFTNLISNAIKYSPPGRPIDVTVTINDAQVTVSISDHGFGIPQNEIPHLFERFFRGSTVRNVRGTGIGLSLVKQFVDMHGGIITVASVVDQGSTFSVSLPRRRPETTKPAVYTPERTPGHARDPLHRG
ncbi:MAG: PAS-domain containing protein [Alphaproteobacteria bacterium]